MVAIIATLVSTDVKTLSEICKSHLERQRVLEDGCTRCAMFISGDTIKLIEQWETEEDYKYHQTTKNLKLFKTLIEPLITNLNIEYYYFVCNY